MLAISILRFLEIRLLVRMSPVISVSRFPQSEAERTRRMPFRVDVVLVLLRRKLNELNLNEKAAEDARPVEEQIAGDLIHAVQELDPADFEEADEAGTSSGSCSGDSANTVSDFEVIGEPAQSPRLGDNQHRDADFSCKYCEHTVKKTINEFRRHPVSSMLL